MWTNLLRFSFPNYKMKVLNNTLFDSNSKTKMTLLFYLYISSRMLRGGLPSNMLTPFPPASNFYLHVPSYLTQGSHHFQKWGLERCY